MKNLSLLFLLSFSCSILAQTFKNPVKNPYGFSPFGYVRNDHFSSFADLDNDGDQDLLVSDFDGVFHYYENTGTSNNPIFAQSVPNPFGISVIDYPNCSCNTLVHRFVDIDADGDQDIIALSWWSSTYFFAENIGDASTPNFKAFEKDLSWMPAKFEIETFVGIDFVDIDNDGDLDFFTCQEEVFSFRLNKGTAQEPDFTSVLVTNAFDINVSGGYLFPSFCDIDDDGDFDLFLGGNKAELNDFQFYENIGSQQVAKFAAPIQNPFNLTNSNIQFPALTFVDLDGDGDQDIFTSGVLNSINDFQYYENAQILSLEDEPSQTQIEVYPNPVSTTLFIENKSSDKIQRIDFVNVLGELVTTVSITDNSIDVTNIPTGQYFLRSETGVVLNAEPILIGVSK